MYDFITTENAELSRQFGHVLAFSEARTAKKPWRIAAMDLKAENRAEAVRLGMQVVDDAKTLSSGLSSLDEPVDENCSLFLFDMGNVVVKNIAMLDAIAMQYGLDRAAFRADYVHYEFPLMEGTITEEQYWDHIHHLFGLRVEGNPFARNFHPVFNDEVVTLIRVLRSQGKRVVCASNTFDSHWQLLGGMGALSLFDAVYASHELGLSKPDVRFYQAILKQENKEAQQAYFVDDYEMNIEQARSISLASLLYADTPHRTASQALHKAFAKLLPQ